MLEWKFSQGNEIMVDEVSSGTTVNNDSGFDDFCTHGESQGSI